MESLLAIASRYGEQTRHRAVTSVLRRPVADLWSGTPRRRSPTTQQHPDDSCSERRLPA